MNAAVFLGDAVGSFLSTWFLAWLLGISVLCRMRVRWRRDLAAVVLAWIIGGLVHGFMEGEGGFQSRVETMLGLEYLWLRLPGAVLYYVFSLLHLAWTYEEPKAEGKATPGGQ